MKGLEKGLREGCRLCRTRGKDMRQMQKGLGWLREGWEAGRDKKTHYGEVASPGAPPPQFMKAITARRQ